MGVSELQVRFWIGAFVALSACRKSEPPAPATITTSVATVVSAAPSASASASVVAIATASVAPPPSDGDPPLAVTPGPAHDFIAAGLVQTCIIEPDRHVRCWGIDPGTATDVPAIANVVSIAAGGANTCVLTLEGRVACWDASVPAKATPSFVPHVRAKAIATTGDKTCAIGGDDNVVCWTSSAPSPLTQSDGTKITATAITASNHFCAITSTTLACWGTGRAFAPHRNMRMAAFSMDDDSPDVPLVLNVKAKRIAIANDVNCTITATDMPDCWGANDQSQRGDAVAETSALDGEGRESFALDSKETEVASGPNLHALDIAAGGSNVCVVGADHQVTCWGANDKGQLGDGTTTARKTPTKPKGVTSSIAIAVGDAHACAVLTSGSVMCWGENINGEVSGTPTTNPIRTPMLVSGITARVTP